MATKTFRGTTNSDWQTATNWLEGSIPVAGDDVVFDASSPNCSLSADALSSGQLKSLIMTNYTNTLNFNGHTINVGQGALNGVIFDGGNTCNFIGNGMLIFYSTTTTANYNRIIGSNPNLQNVNFSFTQNSLGKIFTLLSNMYCKDLYSGNYYPNLTNSGVNIYIYGNISDNSSNNYNYAFQFNSANIYLNGNGTLNCINSIYINSTITVNGNYTLLKDTQITLNNTTGDNNTGIIYNTGYIICNGYDLIILVVGYSFYSYLNFNHSIDNLCIQFTNQSYRPILRIINDITINNKFVISLGATSQLLNTSSYIRSAVNGTKVNIYLGNNCKYLINRAYLIDIAFNKPLTGFYGTYTNCDNISNIELPLVQVTCS